jgi:hypothetical protein
LKEIGDMCTVCVSLYNQIRDRHRMCPITVSKSQK